MTPRERLRAWRKANPEKYKAQQRRAAARRDGAAAMRAWRAKNPDRNRANWRAYVKRNRDRINLRKREWRKNNPERNRAHKRANYARHPEHQKARSLRRYSLLKTDPAAYAAERKRALECTRKHRQRKRAEYNAWSRAYARAYRRKHPDRVRTKESLYRARRIGAVGSHTASQWISRVHLYGWRCFYCGKPLTPETLGKDHRIPLSKGGTDFASNLVPACKSCNSGKGNRSVRYRP